MGKFTSISFSKRSIPFLFGFCNNARLLIILLSLSVSMKAHAEETIPDADFAKRAERWPIDTPDTKEAYFIREIFESKIFISFVILILLVLDVVIKVISRLTQLHAPLSAGSLAETGGAHLIPADVRLASTTQLTPVLPPRNEWAHSRSTRLSFSVCTNHSSIRIPSFG